MEEHVKTFRDLDTEALKERLERVVFHRAMTVSALDSLEIKHENLLKQTERKKMALEQQIAAMEAWRDDHYAKYVHEKFRKTQAIIDYDKVIKVYTEELNRRGGEV